MTGTPAATSCGSGCSSRLATARVRTFEVGQTSSGIRRSARWASSAGSSAAEMPWPIRSAPSSRSASQIVSGPVVSPACGTERNPAARAWSKYGLNCGRGTPISGPPRPKLIRPVGPFVECDPQGLLGGRQPGLAGDVEAPAQFDAEVGPGPLAGVLDRLAERRRGDAPAHVRVGRDGQLGVPDLLAGQFAGHLVGEQPDVLGVPDQVDHAQVDLDEVGEVAEREVVGERLRVGRDGAASLVPGGQLGDDPGRGGADVVHVQLHLGQSGDEGGQVGHEFSSARAPVRATTKIRRNGKCT